MERLRGEETQFAKVKEIESHLLKRRSGSIDENDVEEEEEEEKNLVSAKRRLETIQQKVELATSTKSKADETEKRFKSVAKIAKRRYGYVRSVRARSARILITSLSHVTSENQPLIQCTLEYRYSYLRVLKRNHFTLVCLSR